MTKILLLAIACTLILSGFAKNSKPTNKLRSFVGKNQVINNKMQQSSITGYKAGIREDYTFNNSSGIWIKNVVVSYTYDNMGNTTLESENWWKGGDVWVISNKQISSYNTHNDCTEGKSQNLENNTWVTYGGFQNIYTYDSNNNIVEQVYKNWDSQLKLYINEEKSEYTYSNNTITGETRSDWDAINNVWIYNFRSSGVWYNFLKDQPLSETYQAYINNNWVNAERATYTYTGNNFVVVYDNFVSGNWEHNSRETYSELDTYGSSIYLEENYINGNWVNSQKGTSVYDNKKNETSGKREIWQSGAWVTDSEDKYIYTYDLNNNITSVIHQIWSSQTQLLRNDYKYVYSNYQIILDVPEIAADSQIKMFPNPTNGRFAIQFQDAQQKTENRKVEIYNMLGERVYLTNLTQQTTNEIDLSKSPKGIYMVQVYEGAKVCNRKIVVQ